MRQKMLWLHTGILAVAFVSMMSWQSGSASQSQSTKPAGFEYKIVPIALGEVDEGEKLLKQFDNEGWELVAIQSLKTAATNLAIDANGVWERRKGPFRVVSNQETTDARQQRFKTDAYYIFKRPKVGM